MDVDPPPDVWIDGRVAVKRSTIEGQGLFATSDLPAETLVARLGGSLVSSRELDELIARAEADAALSYVDIVTIYEDAHLVLPPRTVIHFGNHSCDPTTWLIGPYELATKRDVAAGEELTVDYGTQSGADGFLMACHCGSALCRGQISSKDWQRPELQARYRGHWTPALQSRIDRL